MSIVEKMTKCGCCGDDIEASKCTMDNELKQLVCYECNGLLKGAKNELENGTFAGRPYGIKNCTQ